MDNFYQLIDKITEFQVPSQNNKKFTWTIHTTTKTYPKIHWRGINKGIMVFGDQQQII